MNIMYQKILNLALEKLRLIFEKIIYITLFMKKITRFSLVIFILKYHYQCEAFVKIISVMLNARLQCFRKFFHS